DSVPDDQNWRNDGWFDFKIKLPAGFHFETIPIYLNFQQRGTGNYYIRGYACYDWTYFRPAVRLLGADGTPLEEWRRIAGIGLDDYTFVFEVSYGESSNQTRYLEVTQSLPYPPSRLGSFLDELPFLFAGGAATVSSQVIGEGGLCCRVEEKYQEHNPITVIWIYKQDGAPLSAKPVMFISGGIHLEPLSSFVAEGIIRQLARNPSTLDRVNFMVVIHMNPDAQKWGFTEVFPTTGLNSQVWWVYDNPSHESTMLQTYFNELLRAGFDLRLFLNLHCDVAPRDHQAGRMPIVGNYEVASDEAASEACSFISALNSQAEFGPFFRESHYWPRRQPYLLTEPPPQGYGFRYHIIVEMPEVAFYRRTGISRGPGQFQVDHYLVDENELLRLGGCFLEAIQALLPAP
ncbi:hypothetical protein JW905_14180, partial [bacterium]|nr:hypothetical protein [candidate division CSSED10-310 bacterium]